MRKVMLLIVFFILNSVVVAGFNFDSGTELAELQDELFEEYKSRGKISFVDADQLENNLWVVMASRLAPNNLVVRHWCLRDVTSGKAYHKDKIIKLIKVIGPDCIWLEGYSYWLYTKPFLQEYADKFDEDFISEFINCTDMVFIKTAYSRDGELYPTPFGDLRNEPLEESLQGYEPESEISIGVIMKKNGNYTIKGSPLGFNVHANKKDSKITIKEGVPYQKDEEFEWYEGYDKKYKNGFEKFFDYTDLRRVFSIFTI